MESSRPSPYIRHSAHRENLSRCLVELSGSSVGRTVLPSAAQTAGRSAPQGAPRYRTRSRILFRCSLTAGSAVLHVCRAYRSVVFKRLHAGASGDLRGVAQGKYAPAGGDLPHFARGADPFCAPFSSRARACEPHSDSGQRKRAFRYTPGAYSASLASRRPIPPRHYAHMRAQRDGVCVNCNFLLLEVACWPPPSQETRVAPFDGRLLLGK